MKNYKNNNQKGFALYLIVIMMSVLLAAVLGLSNIIIGGVNLAIIVRDSGNAFYAADSGVEKALYLIARALNVSEAWLMGYDVPMERLMYEKNAAEVELLECIQVTFGEKAVQLLEQFIELNEVGKDKAIDTLIDLCMIEKYTEKK